MLTDSRFNRFASAMNYPSQASNSIAPVTVVSAPGSAYQNASYSAGMGGLGTVIEDITAGNFSAIPGDIVSGLGSGDVFSYVVVAGLALLVLPLVLGGSSKSKARQTSRRAALKGAIARESELLKGA